MEKFWQQTKTFKDKQLELDIISGDFIPLDPLIEKEVLLRKKKATVITGEPPINKQMKGAQKHNKNLKDK